ncbi:mechanosensitive ion channel protein MscS [Aphanothece hegewaldii CCALA 016]|uniref:Mechanosensitive ion channel protein MscS n=1 Tax=Aphanothece hegewaldii CCALA 016 TaxID=2107694 RepID=A0A2T1LR97_9CHRO|nr:mechanosensitive ion channel family protein [Aphanothece hegewaldii]PSF31124.1 mechanosensitive ion channel protein MscS [Aphanothece hegewaldii CCALA 016]
MDILITIVEVSFLIIVFSLLNKLINFSFKMMGRSWFRSRTEQLNTLRQNLNLLLLLSCAGLCFALISLNSVLIYQGKSVQEIQINLIDRIPRRFWFDLVTAIAKSLILFLLVKFSIPLLNRGLEYGALWAKNYDRIIANDESIELFFNDLKKTLTNSLWLLVVSLCTQFFNLPNVIPKYLYIVLKAYLAIAVGRMLIKALSALIDTLDALSLQYANSDNLLRYYQRFRHLVPTFKKCLEYLLYVGIATLIIQDIDFIAFLSNYADEIVAIISIYFLCGVAIEITNVILEDLILQTENLTDLQRQRRLTIIPLFKSVLKYSIYFAAGIIILKLINLDPTPLLAGAGILGLVVGFGAQNLINDIVCGFFILFENYYLVGDYIEAGKLEERTVEGIVEAIELRTTQIRHPDGQLQIIRNGEIGSVINYSKQYIYAKVEVTIAHHANLEQIYSLISEVGQQLKEECLDVLEPTYIDGLENFGGDYLILRTLTKVKPGKHLSIQRLLRKMLKSAFDQKEKVDS